MTQSINAAVIQFNSSSDKKANLIKISQMITEAAKKASLICLPEVFNFRSSDLELSRANAEEISGTSINTIQKLAESLNVSILAGSLYLKENNTKKPFNSSILISNLGKIICRYDKIHLFDVTVDNKEILESNKTQSGTKIALAELEGFRIGLSICYDLRFPELYRKYSGAEILLVPSAFTYTTGKAHWHSLLRARAIENQAYVIAPNQWGKADEKMTNCYGHSMIIDPWGNIIAEAKEDQDEIIYAKLDLDFLNQIRNQMPCLDHKKL
jgi:predicted amidohydrolase